MEIYQYKNPSLEKIRIFTSLFKGRTDVFAKRWERADGSVSGYAPVCLNEWKRLLCYKTRGLKCKNCPNKKYASLTDQFIKEHLMGRKTIGIYPLLEDNSSYFLAVDFDGEDWPEQAKKLLAYCKKYHIPGYLERSRSGNGCHIWFFFQDKYPSYKSRTIFLRLLKEAGNIDEFAKEDSFDRLFPNQDLLTGAGIGNLIALPLQGEVIQRQNSVFLNPTKKLIPHKDQWEFLKSVEKISSEKLDKLFDTLSRGPKETRSLSKGGETQITLGTHIFIPKKYLSKNLSNFLTENLNFINSEYIQKQRIGLSVYKIERYFKTVLKDDHNVIIPRGFLAALINYFNENNIKFKIVDERNKLPTIKLTPTFKLFDFQKLAIDCFDDQDSGVLVAPSGSGKTIMGLELITRKAQPALIIVHKKQIFNQWLERIEHFLQIPKREIGQFSAIKKSVKSPITVAMIQSLIRTEGFERLSPNFGLILVDECHHIPAKMFRQTITKFNSYYLYGLTATPKRKNNDEKLIYIYIGDIVYQIPRDHNFSFSQKREAKNLNIIIKETSLSIPFNVKSDDFQLLSKILIFDSRRNSLIAEDVATKAKEGYKCLVLTERKEHVETLNQYLKRDFEVITFTGDLTSKKRQEREKQINEGHFQILIATGQLIGEGTHLENLDCLFLVYPFSFEGKLTQYIGRLEHNPTGQKTIFDYRDKNIRFLENLFKKRKRYYNKIGKI